MPEKSDLEKKIEQRDYEFSIHFSKKTTWVVDPQTKARSFTIIPGKQMGCIVAFHNNHCIQYDLKLESDEQQSNLKELKTIGEMSAHQMAIRGVVVSPNDAIFATHSFDCLKVWTVDLYMSNQKGDLTVACRQSLAETNILSATILPGNKYIVLGSKAG